MDTNPISVYLYSNQPNYPTTYFVSAPDVPGYQCIGVECPFARDIYMSDGGVYFTMNNRLFYVAVENSGTSGSMECFLVYKKFGSETSQMGEGYKYVRFIIYWTIL